MSDTRLSSHVRDVLNEVDTSETAPFVVQGDEVPPVYQKVAASPKSACHQNLSEYCLPLNCLFYQDG